MLTAVFSVTGLAGLAAVWTVWPRGPGVSPLATLFALGFTHVVTAILTWRRSPLAAPAFVAAVGLLLFPATFIVPGGQIVWPSLGVVCLVAFTGYRYLRRVREPAAAR